MSAPSFARPTITAKLNKIKETGVWRADIASLPEEVLSLQSSCRHLLEGREATAGPAFFQASIESRSWIPRIVVVSRGDTIRGLLYAKERKWAGLPAGLIYADATLGSMVLSAAEDEIEVFKIGIARLLQVPRIQGLRLLIPSRDRFDEPLRELRSLHNVDAHSSEVENHCVLDLTNRYDTFLARLGTTTRRNFRYYRRRFEADGNEYVPEMSLADFRTAALKLLPKGVVGAKEEGLKRALAMLAVVDRPMLAGLRSPSGEWLAIVGGWFEADRQIVFCQMNNDAEYPRSSLCIVLRGYLFESLISRSRTKVLFWAGVGQPLLRLCEWVPTTAVYLDRRTLVWRSFRRAFAAAAGFLPARVRSLAHWVSPEKLPATFT